MRMVSSKCWNGSGNFFLRICFLLTLGHSRRNRPYSIFRRVLAEDSLIPRTSPRKKREKERRKYSLVQLPIPSIIISYHHFQSPLERAKKIIHRSEQPISCLQICEIETDSRREKKPTTKTTNLQHPLLPLSLGVFPFGFRCFSPSARRPGDSGLLGRSLLPRI